MLLKGKSALVTGSTSGIGLGIARALAKRGASLTLNGLMAPEAAEKLRLDLSAEFDVPVRFDPADLSRPGEIARMMREAIAAFGGLDVLVNNAGIQHVASTEDFPPEKWDAILAINLSSVFHTVREALPGMRERNWGRIINIASAHGLVASVNKSAYVAAKHGVMGLTKVIALETATTGVTCNAICPGWVLTPLVQAQIERLAKERNLTEAEARRQLLAEKQPSLEFVTPEQIGDTAVFLCSDAASQTRGIALNIDGGWLAQ